MSENGIDLVYCIAGILVIGILGYFGLVIWHDSIRSRAIKQLEKEHTQKKMIDQI